MWKAQAEGKDPQTFSEMSLKPKTILVFYCWRFTFQWLRTDAYKKSKQAGENLLVLDRLI